MSESKSYRYHVLAATILSKGASFLITLVLAKTLSKPDFGAISVGLSFAAIAMPLITLSGSESFLYFACLSRTRLSKIRQLFQDALKVSLGLAVIGVAMILGYAALGGVPAERVWILFVLLLHIPFLNFFNLYLGLLRAYGLNRQYSAATIICAVLLLAFVGLAAFYLQSKTVAVSWVLCYGIVDFFVFRYSLTRKFSASLFEWRRMVTWPTKEFSGYGLKVTLGAAASVATLNADLLFSGFLFGEASTATYRVATLLPMAMMLIPTSFLAADFKNLVAITQGELYWKYYISFVRKIFLPTCFIFLTLSFGGELIILLFFGREYMEAVVLLRILAFLVPIYFFVRTPAGAILNASGNVGVNVKISYACLALLLGLLFVFGSYFGLQGLAWATVVTNLLGSAMSLLAVVKLKKTSKEEFR